jgi:hypothetical protein
MWPDRRGNNTACLRDESLHGEWEFFTCHKSVTVDFDLLNSHKPVQISSEGGMVSRIAHQ